MMQNMHWDYIKKNLDALLPAASALDAEAKLKAMSKNSKESLLQFIAGSRRRCIDIPLTS